MDFPAVLATLNDLPSPFLRPAPWFTQLMDSLAFEAALAAQSGDDVMAQVQVVDNAQDGWLDVWGLLAGIPRTGGEGNSPYLTRIRETILAWVGTLPALQVWANMFAPGGTVTNASPGPGYVITLPATLTSAQVAAFLQSLGRIRPAGMPFIGLQNIGGLFLDTEAYLGAGAVMGSYLTTGNTPITLPISPFTNSMVPLLPSLYFEAPILNPSLTPPVPLA